VNDQAIYSAEKQLRGQVAADFSAKAACYGDGLKRKLAYAAWNVAPATLAGDYKHLAV
jgi:hypothetical protein